jgi:flagellar protein FlaG
MDIKSTGNLPHTGLVNTSTQAISTSSARPVAPAQKQETQATETQVETALQSINQAMEKLAPNLEFAFDKESNRTIVKVVDQETQEIIRQMPSKEALEIAKALDKLQGLLIQQKV